LIVVGEEDEVSIKDVAEMIVEAMNFTGEVHVSLSVMETRPKLII